MSYLSKANKADLITIVEELGIDVPSNPRVIQLTKLILKSPEYDEECIKGILERLENEREYERIEKEKEYERIEKEKEYERLEKEKEREYERLEKEREYERLEKIKEKEREFELKKLEIEAKINSNNNVFQNDERRDLMKLMIRYDSSVDISVYLSTFEKQISRVNVPKEKWVSYLLGLLPLEIGNLITRETDDLADDYDHIKMMLLKRFKLSPEQFRQKFCSLRKEESATWRDYALNLNDLLNEWIQGLEVLNYEDLKELMVVDQVKRRLPSELKEHFIDDLPKLKKVDEFVNKLDEYEAARRHLKNDTKKDKFNNSPDKKIFVKHSDDSRKNISFNNVKCFTCNEFGHKSPDCERNKSVIKCFRCHGHGHTANNCTIEEGAMKKVNTIRVTKSKNFNKSKNEEKCMIKTNGHANRDRMEKEVLINDIKFISTIDTGSEVTLMQELAVARLGIPIHSISKSDVALRGFHGRCEKVLGCLQLSIDIDGASYLSNVLVVPDYLLEYGIVVGEDIISQADLKIEEEVYFIKKPQIFRIFQIKVIENSQPSLDHIKNCSTREKLEECIGNYEPNKLPPKLGDMELEEVVSDEESAALESDFVLPEEFQRPLDKQTDDKVLVCTEEQAKVKNEEEERRRRGRRRGRRKRRRKHYPCSQCVWVFKSNERASD